MAHTWNCRDLGHDCDDTVTGTTHAELVDKMYTHSTEIHAPTLDEVRRQEFIDRLSSALRNSARRPDPQGLRLAKWLCESSSDPTYADA